MNSLQRSKIIKIIFIVLLLFMLIPGSILICYSILKSDVEIFNEDIPSIEMHLTSCGIDNIGNTCFFNACMQCILSLPAFVNYFSTETFNSETQPISIAFKNFIEDYKKSEQSVNPKKFIEVLKGRETMANLFNREAQDASEYLIQFIETIHLEIVERETKSSNLTSEDIKNLDIIGRWFGIICEYSIKCQECENTIITNTLERFLKLNITEGVQKSIDNFHQSVIINDKDYEWECRTQNCGNIIHLDTNSIKSTPRYLIIYNRTLIIESNEDCNVKIYIDQNIKINNTEYKLIGVIFYERRQRHYYAICNRNKWIIFNDASYNQNAKFSAKSNSVYMLLYSQIY
ncbi:uncharacterized protein VICG_00611 [Vittaforma corneae ATCC 50505]|uniref:USP domain-containing protein n=1 Tax=Vittaforma corneae (strain ATCC 50505) TaxID=993615 RepID=L2GQB0_VITCO|nr:uncharacterized protein VICG_00611 [Vittaforma corneae ATCC 50505]ELA42512.1 hypothetical protein VICG_00611 [Vittaforma corneae ATCC 50505]